MIVSCPNCVTKYNLPDEKVPASGIKVKCSKCSHLFKVTPPAAMPEEEVEVLLDDSNDTEPQEDQSSDFDAAFEEAVAGGGSDDDLGEMDFGGAAGGDDLDDMDFGDDQASDDEDLVSGGGAGDDDDDDEDDFGIDDDDDAGAGSGRSDLDLDGDGGLFASLDDDRGARKTGGLGKLLLTVVLFLVLLLVAAVATFNMNLWSLPESMQDAGIELPFDLPLAVPFIKGPGAVADMPAETDDMAEPAPADATEKSAELVGDPTERIKDIQPVEYNQYVINNEVEGRLYVVEGEALNNSPTAKKDIKVEVALFAKDGTEMASKQMLCGNTLSLFQIQVDDQATIEENLASSRGTNLNNAYIKPGESTPFMFVFFGIQGEVETFRITIVDAYEAQK